MWGAVSRLVVQPPVHILTFRAGSTPVHPHDDPKFQPIESGASIFIRTNKNLWRATQEFNLTLNLFDQGGETGYWDGEQLLITVSVAIAVVE